MTRYYLRYILLRCAKFTNSRAKAEAMALYALLAAYLLADESKRTRQVGGLIVCIIDMIGEELAEQWRDSEWASESDEFLADKGMGELAEAVNSLDSFTAALLVLYHVEMMSVKELSDAYCRPIAEIRSVISKGEEAIARYLRRICRDRGAVSADAVCVLLSDLGNVIDSGGVRRVKALVLQHLALYSEDFSDWGSCFLN